MPLLRLRHQCTSTLMAFATCFHTGLPMNMCGHCNGTRPIEKDPFTGGMRVDETPRLQKGRDSAKWVGLGEHQPESGAMTPGLASAATALPRFDGMQGKSQWARDNALRSMMDYVRTVGFIPIPTFDGPVHVDAASPEPVGRRETLLHPRTGNLTTAVRVNGDCETRTAPPKNTTRPIPAKPNYEVCGHARTKRNARQRKDW